MAASKVNGIEYRFSNQERREQGCVLSPRNFTSVLEWAKQKWRGKVGREGAGIDFGDGLRQLLDLRFAADELLPAPAASEYVFLMDMFVSEFAEVGLVLHRAKTIVLTNET